jgi:hypothetical protein
MFLKRVSIGINLICAQSCTEKLKMSYVLYIKKTNRVYGKKGVCSLVCLLPKFSNFGGKTERDFHERKYFSSVER